MPKAVLFDMHGREVPLRLSPDCRPPDVEDWPAALLSFPPFEAWVASFRDEAEFCVTGVELQHVDMFSERASTIGRGARRCGRAKITAHVSNAQGVTARVCMVLRGPSAVCLLLLRTEQGAEHVVIVRQPRLAPASSRIIELPAGFISVDGAFCGRAADEIRRAVPALTFAADTVVDLTGIVHRGDPLCRGIATVPLGSDEQVGVVLCRAPVSAARLDEITASLRTARSAPLLFDVMPLSELPLRTTDARALAAYYLNQKVSELERPVDTCPEL
eukprot:TRINITY_DN16575_c0_g1_i2.p1 TRINITY_DN16575_c0_g1~~TRINITY_DN16575_c0_g1_i2.p1  ORF type:complete len:274 (+),score=84.27 TRINITY_DN16575_c0_g1_i2:68-889(+)